MENGVNVFSLALIVVQCLITVASAEVVYLTKFDSEVNPFDVRTVNIDCVAVNNGEMADVIWYMNGVDDDSKLTTWPAIDSCHRFDPYDKKYSYSKQSNSTHTTHTLGIWWLNQGDTGRYYCSKETYYTNLVVTDFQTTVLQNASITLQCYIGQCLYKNDILYSLTVYKQRSGSWEVISDWENGNGTDTKTAIGVNYTISDVQLSDAGLYKCAATQPRGPVNYYIFEQYTQLNVKVKPTVPGTPILVNATSASIEVFWNASDNDTSNSADNYTLEYMKQTAFDQAGGWSAAFTETIAGLTTTQYTVSLLEPSTSYVMRVIAVNFAGITISATKENLMTNESRPESPSYHGAVVGLTDVTVHWSGKTNAGAVTSFLLTIKMYNESTMNYEYYDDFNIPVDKPGKTRYNYTVYNLTSHTKYCCVIQAKNNAGTSLGDSCSVIETDRPAPEPPKLLQVLPAQNQTGSLEVRIKPSLCTYTDPSCLTFYQANYSKSDQANSTDVWLYKRVYPDQLNAVDVNIKSFVLNDLETGFAYDIKVAGAIESKRLDEMIYTGDFTNLSTSDIVAALPTESYSPGISGEFLTASSIPINITPVDDDKNGMLTVTIAIVVVAIVLVTLIIVIVVVMRMRRNRMNIDTDEQDYWIELHTPLLGNGWPGYVENDYENVQIDRWAEHVREMHANTDIKFTEEFESILKTATPDSTWENSRDPANLIKNRYNNIVAFDNSRVVLSTLPGIVRSDYINANYIDSYDKQKAFIATQGPLPNTINDFWRMVWENNTNVIVMITNVYEKLKKKCEQYWPNEGEQLYGKLSVTLLSSEELAYWTIRRFVVKNTKISKKKHQVEKMIVQYHYTDWPDHGVPEYTLPVLSFVKKACAASPMHSGPIVVHCSAGVGRTGTFIVLESMMKQITLKRSVNVLGFLRHIRTLRPHMVQTEDQYIFIHDALLHFIERGGRTEIKPSKMKTICDELETSFDGSGETTLDKQYKTITKWKPSPYLLAHAQLDIHKSKNRSDVFVPLDNSSRVKLPKIAGQDGSDYINASYLHGFYQNQEFIVTQHPSAQTEFDFWRMVWDQNCMTVVILSNLGMEDLVTFYRPKGESTDWDHQSTFKLTFTEDNLELIDYIVRDFQLESKQDDYEMVTKMFAITCWPEAYTSPQLYNEGVFQFIEVVIRWHESKRNQAGPIIVIDKYGGKVAAEFCALYTLYNQYHQDNTIDIYSLAHIYHQKRPGIWESKEDYQFLYSSMIQLCEKSSSEDKGLENDSAGNDAPDHFSNTFAHVRRINTLPRSPDHQPKTDTF